MSEPHATHLRGVFRRIAGPYPAASVIALAAVNAVDVALIKGPLDVGFLLFLAGLVLCLGTLHGLFIQGLQAAARRTPPWVALAYWPLVGLSAAALLALELGGFSRLEGRYRMLALGLLGACAVAGAWLGGLFALLQPTAKSPRGYLRGQRRRVRIGVAVVLFAAAGACVYADRRLHADLYPLAHEALRLCCLWQVMAGLVLLDAELPLPRLSPVLALLVVGWTAVPLVMLDDSNLRALQAFAVRPWPSMVLRAARAPLDFDRDGHASLLGGGDCAPWDGRVHPGAREVPGNGIDDNCMLGDAKREVDSIDHEPVPKTPSPMDIVLITIDSLRPDHLGLYNPEEYGPRGRATTPNLDAWSDNAMVFEHAYTSGGWTSLALPSLMRGLYPRRLKWQYFYETTYYAMIHAPIEPQLRPGEKVERTYPMAFKDPHPPLALRLQRRGMYTMAVLDDGYCELFTKGIGTEIGIDTYYEADRQGRGRRGDPATVDLALTLLRRNKTTKPFFMWVHMFGVHGPDEFHEGAKVYGQTQTDLYDHEVSGLDREIIRLLDGIALRPRPTAVFITADHGEAMEPAPRHHGVNLDEEAIRIPLIARVPGWPTGRSQALVSLVDIVPTILALTETPVPQGLDGRDLIEYALNRAPTSRILLSDTFRYDNLPPRIASEYVAAFDSKHKVVLDRMRNYLLIQDLAGGGDWLPESGAASSLTNAVYGYIDETGGAIRIGD